MNFGSLSTWPREMRGDFRGQTHNKLRWSMLLSPLEFQLLRRQVPKAGLLEEATVQQCLTAIAKLGGHLKRNGRPIWQSPQTGWRQLQDLALGVRLVSDEAFNP